MLSLYLNIGCKIYRTKSLFAIMQN